MTIIYILSIYLLLNITSTYYFKKVIRLLPHFLVDRLIYLKMNTDVIPLLVKFFYHLTSHQKYALSELSGKK